MTSKHKRPYRVQWDINPRERVREGKKKDHRRCKSTNLTNKDIISEEDLEDLADFFS